MKHLLMAAAFAASVAGPGWGQGALEGKTLTYIIATSPGGGYDTYGRLIGKYLGDELGARTVVFQNMPGAGHILGANFLYNSAPDGLTIGTFNTGLIYAQILGQEGVQFDLNQFSWVGKAASDARVVVLASNSPFKSFEDLQAAQDTVLFAASGVGSANYTETKLLTSAFDLKIDMVAGFNGNEGEMAMMRGEVVGQVASLESLRPFVDAGNGFFALAMGGDLQPQAIDYATTDKARSIVNLIAANSDLGRLTAAPPGLAPEVLEELRDAYMAVFENPDFLAEAEGLSLQIDPARGDAVAELVAAALDQNPETVALIEAAVSEEAPLAKVTATIETLEDRNKIVGFRAGGQDVTGEVSGSRTALTVNGAEAERDALAVGMVCAFEYDPAGAPIEFKSVACEGAAAAEAALVKVSSEILALADEGKVVTFSADGAEKTGEISGSRTALTIGGAEAKRDALTVGMTCEFEFDPAAGEIEFKTVSCN